VEELTIDELKSALPERLRKNLSPTVMARVNAVLGDPEVYETYRENLLGYAHVLREGRFKMTNYVDAVKYVSYKLLGKVSREAFTLVFPEKIKKWTMDGVEGKDQASYITAYNASKLVNLIFEQSLIPVHVLNRDNYQRAINVQIGLMLTAKSEMVRTTAANSVMTHLKPPEKTQIDINVTTESDSVIDNLLRSTGELVEAQKAMLASGAMNAQQIAQQRIIPREDVVVEEGDFEEVAPRQPPPKQVEQQQDLFD